MTMSFKFDMHPPATMQNSTASAPRHNPLQDKQSIRSNASMGVDKHGLAPKLRLDTVDSASGSVTAQTTDRRPPLADKSNGYSTMRRHNDVSKAYINERKRKSDDQPRSGQLKISRNTHRRVGGDSYRPDPESKRLNRARLEREQHMERRHVGARPRIEPKNMEAMHTFSLKERLEQARMHAKAREAAERETKAKREAEAAQRKLEKEEHRQTMMGRRDWSGRRRPNSQAAVENPTPNTVHSINTNTQVATQDNSAPRPQIFTMAAANASVASASSADNKRPIEEDSNNESSEDEPRITNRQETTKATATSGRHVVTCTSLARGRRNNTNGPTTTPANPVQKQEKIRSQDDEPPAVELPSSDNSKKRKFRDEKQWEWPYTGFRKRKRAENDPVAENFSSPSPSPSPFASGNDRKRKRSDNDSGTADKKLHSGTGSIRMSSSSDKSGVKQYKSAFGKAGLASSTAPVSDTTDQGSSGKIKKPKPFKDKANNSGSDVKAQADDILTPNNSPSHVIHDERSAGSKVQDNDLASASQDAYNADSPDKLSSSKSRKASTKSSSKVSSQSSHRKMDKSHIFEDLEDLIDGLHPDYVPPVEENAAANNIEERHYRAALDKIMGGLLEDED